MATWQPDVYGAENPHTGDLAGGAYISITRIILLTIASYGVYPIYWMYRTWKQYRDHTGDEAYPVWHALTQLVPIYLFFRFHAHGRVIKELMRERGIADNLRLGVLVTIWIIAAVLEYVAWGSWADWANWIAEGGDEPGLSALLWAESVGWIGIALALIAVCWMQANLNRYWADVDERLTKSARFGKGEILCILIGAVLWAVTLSDYIW